MIIDYIIFSLARSFFLQSLSLFNRRSQRQQTSADRQNTEVYFEYCLSRWMHIIRRITAVASVSLDVLCDLKLVAIRVNSWFNQNMKTKPKQSQTKPIFRRSNPILSPKTGIFDKFRTTFLCKTKPIQIYLMNITKSLFDFTYLKVALCPLWLSKYFQKTQKMQNEPNLNIILTYLTKEMKRTSNDFYQKEAKKTNPILTKS